MEDQFNVSLLESMAIFMREGGVFMWVILSVWSFGIGIGVERTIAFLRYSVKAKSLMAKIKSYVIGNDVGEAITLCSRTRSLLPQVMRSGLKRANQSREQISDALEATVLEVSPRVERGLGTLSLMANISTLVGLLGTIYGLIQSFAAVAGADPAEKSKLLALGIAKAMNTTALGLISAIILMLVHVFLSGKAEKILSEIDEYSVKLLDLLGTRKRQPDPQVPEATPKGSSQPPPLEPQHSGGEAA